MTQSLALRLFKSASFAVAYQFPKLNEKDNAEMTLDELVRRHDEKMTEDIIEMVLEYENQKQWEN